MIEFLKKVDGVFFALVGAIGWVLQTRAQQGVAAVLGGVAVMLGLLGLALGVAVWRMGGHQAPGLAAGIGHSGPSLTRASCLVGLAWMASWAAAEAGVNAATLAPAIAVAVFGVAGDFIRPIKEELEKLRPSAFGQRAIRSSYARQFSGNANALVTSAYNAVFDDNAEILRDSERGPVRVKSIVGWGLSQREERLTAIANALS